MLFRVFVGGSGREELVEQSDGDLVALARRELADLLGLRAQPLDHGVWRWRKGNPQYDVGHLDRVARMEAMAANVPGLHLAGSAFRGIGLPDCVDSARRTVDHVLRQIAGNP